MPNTEQPANRKAHVLLAAGGACVALGLCGVLLAHAPSNAQENRAEPSVASRSSPDRAPRRNAWDVVARITQSSDDGAPAFTSWRRAEAVLGANPRAKSSVHSGPAEQSAEPEIIISTYYNEIADRHIQTHRLHLREELDQLLKAGRPDPQLTHARTIPPLPDGSIVVLTAWWPIARDASTPLPIWDPQNNPPRRHGNNYMTWPRVVAVDRNTRADTVANTAVTFVGREFSNARTVPLERFHHMVVDRPLADQILEDSRTSKAAVIALGRAIEPGDSLALVAMHVVAKEQGQWRWATLWWHDEADRGAFAGDRPSLAGPWSNYLMDVAVDPSRPGTPNACFNPWLEARFPDQGSGGGTTSNCIACHQRASYPPVSFLSNSTADDPAYAPGRLRTDFLWSLARQSQ